MNRRRFLKYDALGASARHSSPLTNMTGWPGGRGIAAVAFGWIAERSCLGLAISLAGLLYLAAGIFLLTAGVRFVPGDVA